MDQPILLTCKELLKPINYTLKRIETIRERKMANDDELILEGLFVLSVASFEQSITDTLKVLYNRIPAKLDIKTEIIPKAQILEGNALKYTIDNRINSLSYKNLQEIIEHFCKATGINETTFDTEDLKFLFEIKASRNLLLHNNLHVNSIYIETSGEKGRSTGIGSRLKVDQNYLFQSIMTLRKILEDVSNALSNKYSPYTKTKALRNLFDYTFNTPILNFNDEFQINSDSEGTGGMRFEQSKYDSLSSSEQYLYSIWISHISNRPLDVVRAPILHLDGKNRTKLKFIIDSIELFKS